MARGDRIFLRGGQWWCRTKNIKGEWVNRRTPYASAEEPLAARYAAALHVGAKLKREGVAYDLEPEPYIPVRCAEQVYAVMLWPTVRPGRLKIGHTGSLRSRLGNYWTSNPEAVLLAYWEGNESDEQLAFYELAMSCNGSVRVGRSEVFDCEDVAKTLAVLDARLGKRLGGASIKPADLVF